MRRKFLLASPSARLGPVFRLLVHPDAALDDLISLLRFSHLLSRLSCGHDELVAGIALFLICYMCE
jgi:hypothetical protein